MLPAEQAARMPSALSPGSGDDGPDDARFSADKQTSEEFEDADEAPAELASGSAAEKTEPAVLKQSAPPASTASSSTNASITKLSPRQQERLDSRGRGLNAPTMTALQEERGRHVERTKKRDRSLTPQKRSPRTPPREGDDSKQTAHSTPPRRAPEGEVPAGAASPIVIDDGDESYFASRAGGAPSSSAGASLIAADAASDVVDGGREAPAGAQQSASWLGYVQGQLSGFVDFSHAAPVELADESSSFMSRFSPRRDASNSNSPVPGIMGINTKGSGGMTKLSNDHSELASPRLVAGTNLDALDVEAKDEMIASLKQSLREKADRCDRFEELLHQLLQIHNTGDESPRGGIGGNANHERRVSRNTVDIRGSSSSGAAGGGAISSPRTIVGVVPANGAAGATIFEPGRSTDGDQPASDLSLSGNTAQNLQLKLQLQYDGPAPGRPGRASDDELNCLMQAAFSAVKNMKEELDDKRSSCEKLTAAVQREKEETSRLQQRLLHTENLQREIALLRDRAQTAERAVESRDGELGVLRERVLVAHQEMAGLRDDLAHAQIQMQAASRTSGALAARGSAAENENKLDDAIDLDALSTEAGDPDDGSTSTTASPLGGSRRRDRARRLAATVVMEGCQTLKLCVDAWIGLARDQYRRARGTQNDAQEREGTAVGT
mmetsp:Transcript_5051/g.12762  ORF Transcript_5051/g.12762 Transcript_5051/m.12762 type:complete len:667 (+) Transcript_5051:256-2256(+)|eukprot:CAMPEP_0178999144 /NCGR_PEP_ID=MMETSP0795-20121207/9890_1 /TAXON_ID=88552 /ORGANISM="Amoebophrya sp., Strain Ameob2" /LENGTH=666 /DNA_ID=CAMNT_0020691871 /DNA_START=242 /DNA_END=2242 /DNA_ORIENTATION=+